MKNYMEETKRNFTYKYFAEKLKTQSPNECMLFFEMTRKNQEKVLANY